MAVQTQVNGNHYPRTTIGGVELRILKTLYRTRGSQGQMLSEKVLPTTEHSRRFHVAEDEKDGTRYWVKEYVGTQRDVGTADDEYCRYKAVSKSRLVANGIHVRPAMAYACDGNRIVIEYVEGLRFADFERQQPRIEVSRFREALKWWLEQAPIAKYDLNANNVIVLERGGGWECVLVDFELCDGRVRI